MVTMQKRASGSQVRGNSFVNSIQTPPLGSIFRSGGQCKAKPRDYVMILFPDVRLKNILPTFTKLNINNEAQNKTFRL